MWVTVTHHQSIRIEIRRISGIWTGKNSRELREFGLAYVHHVDPIARMYTTYVGAHVRGMPRPVDAVRTIVPRRLAALDPAVILQVLLHAEYAAAIAARKARFYALIVPVCDRSIVAFLPRVPQQRLGSCKKKAHETSFYKARENHRVASSLNLYTDLTPGCW